MNELWWITGEWLLRSWLIGSSMLLVAYLAVRLLSPGTLAYHLASGCIRAAVLVPLFCLIPTWIPILPVTDQEAAPLEEMREVIFTSPNTSPSEAGFVEPISHDQRASVLDSAVISATYPSVDLEPRQSVLPEPATTPAEDPAPGPVWSDSWVSLAVLAYLAVVVGHLIKLGVGALSLARLRRSANAPPESIRTIWKEVACDAKPRLLVSDRVQTPVCFGIRIPTIVLPESLLTTVSRQELDWIFAHELDHLRRGDHRLLWWMGVAQAFYFAAPWLPLLRRQLDLLQEYLADAAASDSGDQPAEYATFLVNLSSSSMERRRTLTPVLAMGANAGRSDLFRRITMLLQFHSTLRRPVARHWRLMLAGGAITTALLLSGVGGAAADDDAPKPAEKQNAPRDGEQPRKGPRDGEQPRKGPRDGEQPRKGPRDGEQPRKGPRDGERAPVGKADLERYFDKIQAAARRGDAEGLKQAMEELQRSMQGGQFGQFRVLPFGGGEFRFPVRPQPPAVDPEVERLRADMEKTIKGFDEAIEQAKDEKVKENLRKTRDEYRKTAEASLKKATEQARNRRLVEPFPKELPFNPGEFPKFPGLPGFEFPGVPGFAVGGAGSPRFGVQAGPIPEPLLAQLDLPADKGLLVHDVVPNSAADKAGLRKNDVLLSFAGTELSGDPRQLSKLVADAEASKKIDVEILRKGKKETLKGIELPKAEKPRAIAGVGGIPRIKLNANGTNFNSMQVQVQNNEFTIRADQNGTKYEIIGTIENGSASPSSITIEAGKKIVEAKSVKFVPEEYRNHVTELLKSVSGK